MKKLRLLIVSGDFSIEALGLFEFSIRAGFILIVVGVYIYREF